jgi:DNA-binding transcriptional LysR family regulator
MREQINGEVEVRHFRAFLAVAAERNFTRAANRLYMSQPALSRCVAQLEHLLGERLVHRMRQQVTLTPAGARLLPHARMVLESLQNAVRAALGESTRLRVGFTTDSSFAEIPLIVRAFENSHPGIGVDFVGLDRQFEGLVNGLCDLEFVRGSSCGPNISSTLLFQEPRMAALPCDHGLAGKAGIKMEDISEEQFVVAVGSMPSLDLAPLGLAAAKIIPVNSIDAWMIAIGVGRGIGITDRSVADLHKSSCVWFAELRDSPPASVWAAWPSNAHCADCDILVKIAQEITKETRNEESLRQRPWSDNGLGR